MKENKWAIRVSLILTLCALVVSTFSHGWWQGFSFAIFGSSFLAFVISLINYLTIRQRMIIGIIDAAFSMNYQGCASLYSIKGKPTSEDMASVIGLCTSFYFIIPQIYFFNKGLFWFQFRLREKVYDMMVATEGLFEEFFDLSHLIEKRKEEAHKHAERIYARVDELLEVQLHLKPMIEIAQKFKIPVKMLNKEENAAYKENRADATLKTLA